MLSTEDIERGKNTWLDGLNGWDKEGLTSEELRLWSLLEPAVVVLGPGTQECNEELRKVPVGEMEVQAVASPYFPDELDLGDLLAAGLLFEEQAGRLFEHGDHLCLHVGPAQRRIQADDRVQRSPHKNVTRAPGQHMVAGAPGQAVASEEELEVPVSGAGGHFESLLKFLLAFAAYLYRRALKAVRTLQSVRRDLGDRDVVVTSCCDNYQTLQRVDITFGRPLLTTGCSPRAVDGEQLCYVGRDRR